MTIADYTLLALVPKVHKELGAFIPLIVANCMILGRQEAFASRYPVRLAVMDAHGYGRRFPAGAVLARRDTGDTR